MFNDASPDSRSLDMVDLRYVFNLLSVLNERSHLADVIGKVQKNLNQGVDVTKEISIACCECLNFFVVILSLRFWD